MSVISVTQEAEIRKIAVQSQTRQIVHETPSRKYPSHTHTQKGLVEGLRQSPEFKPQYCKIKKGRVGWVQWLKPVVLVTQEVEASWGSKFERPHLNQWLGVAAHTCHPRYAGKHKIGG
jgi:hypothetical protein